MTIRAKFESKCSACGQQVKTGEKVIWEPGQKTVKHVKCPAKPRGITVTDAGTGEKTFFARPKAKPAKPAKETADFHIAEGNWLQKVKVGIDSTAGTEITFKDGVKAVVVRKIRNIHPEEMELHGLPEYSRWAWVEMKEIKN